MKKREVFMAALRNISKMPIRLSTDWITPETPMGATLLPSKIGATFKVWAPRAREIKLLWDFRP
jgi:hypothetical protein